jgi:ABC-2 type transport system ATP-binding protein
MTFAEAPAALPPALAARGARLVGHQIEVTQPEKEDLGPLLQEALSAGLVVRDVETRRADLEDIYVRLLRNA